MRTSKTRTIISIVAVVSVIIAIIAIAINLSKNARLTVIVAPIDSEIRINGRKRNNGTSNFLPGDVTITVSHDGLDEKNISLHLEPHHTTTAYIYLTKDGSFDYYEGSPADYEALKIITDDDAKDFIKETERKLSIIDILPLSYYAEQNSQKGVNGFAPTRETVISDGTSDPKCKKIICLTLLDDTGSDETAKNLLRQYGYNFDDYEIIRKN